MTHPRLEFAAAADAVERGSKFVTIGRDGERCRFCGAVMRRAEYRARPKGPILLVRDLCPKCRAQTRMLKPWMGGGR